MAKVLHLLLGQDSRLVGQLSRLISSRRDTEANFSYVSDVFSLPKLDSLRMFAWFTDRLKPLAEDEQVRAFVRKGSTICPLMLSTGPLFWPDALKKYHMGATFVFQKIDALVPQWSRIANSFELYTGQPVQMNLYVGAPGQPGLDWHRDPHDVLVVQLAGDKVFELADNIDGGFPMNSRTVHLKPGDILFIDRGTPHRAINGKEGSLHLAVGLLYLSGSRQSLKRCTGPDEQSHSTGYFWSINERFIPGTAEYLANWRSPYNRCGRSSHAPYLAPDHFAMLVQDVNSRHILTRSGWHDLSATDAEILLGGHVPGHLNADLINDLAYPHIHFSRKQNLMDYFLEV
jgi:quercetin dioxygenase-like cupin family protein